MWKHDLKGVKRHLRVEGELTVRKKNDRQQEGRRHWGRKDKKKNKRRQRGKRMEVNGWRNGREN